MTMRTGDAGRQDRAIDAWGMETIVKGEAGSWRR